MSGTLGVIPARGGSKSIPRKNIALLAGKPLIGYTIEAAIAAKRLDDIVVSTDDAEIAEISNGFHGNTPFMRPPELATDDALTIGVVQHATTFMEEARGSSYDHIILLQPTSPLRTSQDIDDAVEKLIATNCDSVVSVVDVDGYHPFRMKRFVEDRLINFIDQGFEDMRPRQILPRVYIRNGAVYGSTRNVVMSDGTLVGDDCRGIIMSSERSINIDSPSDFLLAEEAMSKGI
jgi:CMP-N,N'-diacetyllegionaminic acid synthase